MLQYIDTDIKCRKSYFYDSKNKKLRFVKKYRKGPFGYKLTGIYIGLVLLEVFGIFDNVIYFLDWGTPALKMLANYPKTPILLGVFLPGFLVFLWECSSYRKSGIDASEEEYYWLERVNERQTRKRMLFLFWLFLFFGTGIIVHIISLGKILFYYLMNGIAGMEFAYMLILDNPFIKVVREKSGYGAID